MLDNNLTLDRQQAKCVFDIELKETIMMMMMMMMMMA